MRDELEPGEEAPGDEVEDEVEASARHPGGAGFAMGIAVGALLGAAAVLLFAPASGRVTRRRLQRKLEDVRERAGEEWDDLSRKARRELRKRMESVT